MKIYYDALNSGRFSLLENFKGLKENFYLAGGTGLALQIGHRISEVFDFFTSIKFDNAVLLNQIKKSFPNLNLKIIQNEENTLTLLINNEVKISFFKIEYQNILPLIQTDYLQIAQVQEIGVMKLLALTRALYKDYVDIFFILKEYSLNGLLSLAKRKYHEFDESIYLKCLLSFSDIEKIPVVFMPGRDISPEKVFKFIEEQAINYLDEKK